MSDIDGYPPTLSNVTIVYGTTPNLTMNAPTMDGPMMNIGQLVQVVMWMLAAVSGIFLGLRMFCKFYGRLGLWWDDYVLIASWVSRPLQCCASIRFLSYLFFSLSGPGLSLTTEGGLQGSENSLNLPRYSAMRAS